MDKKKLVLGRNSENLKRIFKKPFATLVLRVKNIYLDFLYYFI